MRAMGWTRKQLEEHSDLELQGHYTILEYEAAQAEKARLEAEHEAALMRKSHR